MKHRLLLSSILLAASAWFCGPASANCIGLNCSCSINANDVNFGTYNPISPSAVDVVGTVSVTCGASVVGVFFSYDVQFGPGSSGNALARTMSNGGSTLAYNLYPTPARVTVWGSGTGGTGVMSNSYLLSLIFTRTDNYSIYGRIPGGQAVTAGSYSDTLVATVVF